MWSGSRWREMVKAIWGRFGEVEVTDRAAALTYYAILSLFPAMLVVVALLALLVWVVRQDDARRRAGGTPAGNQSVTHSS
jgi:uncharacterized BrkB/YihY/UPF0761 family membrane protein